MAVEGATSLKAAIAERVPQIRDAADFRLVRKLVREELGGAQALYEELVFSGFVDPDTGKLTLGDRPFNIFAKIAAGVVGQPGLEAEQLHLGEYQSRYVICKNKPEKDMYWDSEDPEWWQKASMSRHHRFLTTKDLNWRWFNALAFGLASPDAGGFPLGQVIEEVEAMMQAAVAYTKSIGGWSDNIGLFVNIFGHNNVNSLFVHVLDMAALGPAFQAQQYKNLPLSSVLKVLKEEASAGCSYPLLPPPITCKANMGRRWSISPRRTSPSGRYMFFQGKGGATSIKAESVARVPVCKDAADYREARQLLKTEFGGVHSLREELSRAGFVDPATSLLTTGTQPFNLFARLASGEMTQPGMDAEQQALGSWADEFLVCCNKPENDLHWDSTDPRWVGRASMARRHRFLTTRKLHWQWFNPLVFGMLPEDEGGSSAAECVAFLESMQTAALTYTTNVGSWSDDIGLYFHVFGHCSVNSLHLHMVDLSETGPGFERLRFKNMPLDQILKVLLEEAAAASGQQLRRISTEPVLGAPSFSSLNPPSMRDSPGGPTVSMVPTASVKTYVKDQDILELNVGGEHIDVARKTLLLAPVDSILRDMFEGGDWSHDRDRHGRIYLEFPPAAFKHIVDRLRVRRLSQQFPEQVAEEPPAIPKDQLKDVRVLAEILGVQEVIALRRLAPENGSDDQAAGTMDDGCTCLDGLRALMPQRSQPLCPPLPSLRRGRRRGSPTR